MEASVSKAGFNSSEMKKKVSAWFPSSTFFSLQTHLLQTIEQIEYRYIHARLNDLLSPAVSSEYSFTFRARINKNIITDVAENPKETTVCISFFCS